jgi:hypothetical protein
VNKIYITLWCTVGVLLGTIMVLYSAHCDEIGMTPTHTLLRNVGLVIVLVCGIIFVKFSETLKT